MNSSKFEKSFENAKQIVFFKTENYNIEPPVISIIFENQTDGIEAYQFLQNNLTKDEICLTFHLKNDSEINMTIIDKKNSNFFNINNLKFSLINLIDFRKNSEFGKYCVFCISQLINNQMVLSKIVIEKPLMVSELIFSES